MAKFVVHFLEAVEIKEKNRKFLAQARQPVEGAFEAFAKGETVRQLRQGIPPDRPFGLQLSNGASGKFDRIGENAAQKHEPIGHNKDSDEQIDEIAVSAEANCRTHKDRSRECNCRHRNRGEGECTAREHPGAKARYHQLPAIRGVCEESHWNDRPGGSENERISHQPMHGPAGHEMRLGNRS